MSKAKRHKRRAPAESTPTSSHVESSSPATTGPPVYITLVPDKVPGILPVNKYRAHIEVVGEGFSKRGEDVRFIFPEQKTATLFPSKAPAPWIRQLSPTDKYSAMPNELDIYYFTTDSGHIWWGLSP